MLMIERVARAIAESCSGPWDFLSPEGQEAARHEARAALEAMREPTPLMLAYGWAAINEGRTKPVDMAPGPALREAFPAMISAALAEEPRPCG